MIVDGLVRYDARGVCVWDAGVRLLFCLLFACYLCCCSVLHFVLMFVSCYASCNLLGGFSNLG